MSCTHVCDCRNVDVVVCLPDSKKYFIRFIRPLEDERNTQRYFIRLVVVLVKTFFFGRFRYLQLAKQLADRSQQPGLAQPGLAVAAESGPAVRQTVRKTVLGKRGGDEERGSGNRAEDGEDTERAREILERDFLSQAALSLSRAAGTKDGNTQRGGWTANVEVGAFLNVCQAELPQLGLRAAEVLFFFYG